MESQNQIDKKNLTREEKEALAQKKLQEIIKQKLLSIGGEDVEFLDDTFSMQINIFQKGKLINPVQPFILCGERDDECEIESLKLYKQNKQEKEYKNLQFLSGFALGKNDQIWRLHSWLQAEKNDFSEQRYKDQVATDEEFQESTTYQNKNKYKNILESPQYQEQIKENRQKNKEFITLETTIEEIELYYGYVADNKEIQLRTQNCEKFFDEKPEINEENDQEDENLDDLEDLDDFEDFEGEDDEEWEDDEDDDQEEINQEKQNKQLEQQNNNYEQNQQQNNIKQQDNQKEEEKKQNE
ncbi:hypothetical protein PPERSA_04176 [Pseudocohnilembus persalinus]|uniref:Uncharacterized protein n=1 Tax=Pseudocohnilembus persalinus TaxID=266149 RepID=A0A0V0QNI1_PSEPJ|nr:hypothetical protein PPERSA_04176 [Pseudocohnilembus persalinus]|eukprot:KRX03624.1 hypothetical protein PPERSA_04176 [Pseudocohnilembus persalinus]